MSRCGSVRDAARYGSFAAFLIAAFAAPPALAQEAPPEPEIITITSAAGAFANGIFNSAIRNNSVTVDGGTYESRFENSGLGNIGVLQINQDVGIASNQANIVSIALAAGAESPVTMASFYGEIVIADNAVTVGNVTFTNIMQTVAEGSVGITQINTNSGIANSNVNALTVALGISPGPTAIAMGDSSLSVTKTGNTLNLTGPVNIVTVPATVSNATGIVQINQTNGIFIDSSNTLTIRATVVTIP